jgi:hypothetical protein
MRGFFFFNEMANKGALLFCYRCYHCCYSLILFFVYCSKMKIISLSRYHDYNELLVYYKLMHST